MLKVLVIGSKGIGINLISKVKIEKVLSDMNIDARVQFASITSDEIEYSNYDVLMVSKDYVDGYESLEGLDVIGLNNMISEEEISESIGNVLSSNYSFA